MLASLFLYSLKSALILALLYAGYLWLFRNNNRYRLKRAVLLSMVLLALVLPSVEWQVDLVALPAQPNIDRIEAVVSTPPISLETDQTNSISISETGKALHWTYWLIIAYWLGVAVSLVLLLRQLSQIMYLALFAKKRNDLGRKVISHRIVSFPFSFWKWTFLPADFDYDPATWQIVDRHELAHQEQWHTLDLLLLSVVRCFLWFNPVVYLLQNSVKENHEFLADQSVLTMHSMEEYSQALLAVCLNSPSLHLAHSFSLKSNLSKRIKNMNRQRTSILKSGVALSTFLSIVLLVVTQVSLYGQLDTLEMLDNRLNSVSTYNGNNSSANFNSYKVYQKTGQDPDQWLILERGAFPLLLLQNHKNTLEEYRENAKTDIVGQLDYTMRLLLGKTDNPNDANPFNHPFSEMKTELTVRLTIDERIAMYQMAKEWHEKYTRQAYPDYELMNEVDFMEHEFLFFMSQPSMVDPRKYGVDKARNAEDIDVKPTPYGGMEHFLKNIIKLSEMDASLKATDLPEKIEFEFTIDQGGNLVMLKPTTEVNGPDEVADKVYAWLGQLNRNIIKVSEVYRWKPGRIGGVKVATKMRLEIPKHLL